MSNKSKLYCPYCKETVKFKQIPKLDVKGCEKCGISERDFDVKMENRLWENINKKKKGDL